MSDAAERALAMADRLGAQGALADLLADPTRAQDLAPERAAALLAQLAALQAALAARLQVMPVAVAHAEERADTDRLLTVQQAAEALNVTVGWMYRHAPKLPFTRKLSRRLLRFSGHGLRAWADKQRPLTVPYHKREGS